MQALSARERRLTGLTRGARAAVVVPSLLALALLVIKQPQAAGFTVFGTFAHLVMVDYDSAARNRFTEAALLTVLGAIMLSLGTLASANVWLAVGGAVVVGAVTQAPSLAEGRIGVIRPALLLSFALSVAAPAPARSVFPYLSGWLLAGIAAQPALLVIWVRLQSAHVASDGGPSGASDGSSVGPADRQTWIGKSIGAGAAMGVAVLLTRLLKVDHAFWVILGMLPVLNATGTSASRTFWQEQAGTLTGFLIGAALVAIIGAHVAWYWLALPFIVFASAYASSAIGFMAGQASFTVFAVSLFCILSPHQGNVGILRVEDIAFGGAVSLIVGSLRRLGEATPRNFVAWIGSLLKTP